jgi:hypothetical protein
MKKQNPQLESRCGHLRCASLTVSAPARYIVPGTIFDAITSTSDEFSSSFDNKFVVTD